jgi:hypothetical protein
LASPRVTAGHPPPPLPRLSASSFSMRGAATRSWMRIQGQRITSPVHAAVRPSSLARTRPPPSPRAAARHCLRDHPHLHLCDRLCLLPSGSRAGGSHAITSGVGGGARAASVLDNGTRNACWYFLSSPLVVCLVSM